VIEAWHVAGSVARECEVWSGAVTTQTHGRQPLSAEQITRIVEAGQIPLDARERVGEALEAYIDEVQQWCNLLGPIGIDSTPALTLSVRRHSNLPPPNRQCGGPSMTLCESTSSPFCQWS
jgi:hypothetical protein